MNDDGAADMKERETAVLFAGVVAGERADSQSVSGELSRLSDVLKHASQVGGGRFVARQGSEAMALFPTSEAAATAVLRMHAYARALSPATGRWRMRFGVHSGALGRQGDQFSGDTIDHALELLHAARENEALISVHAAARLGAQLRACVSLAPGGVFRMLPEDRMLAPERFSARPGRLALRLAYRSRSIVRRRDGDRAIIGSDAACDLAVDHRGASQRHCTISRRGGTCVLRDHSANGTFVSIEGGSPRTVRGEEIVLTGQGLIGFGVPGEPGSEDPVHFSFQS
jgi:adenylate cyclase